MNIKILDSWLREYVETDANIEEIAKLLSLSSASVEKLEKIGSDYTYDLEITTNRPDLMSLWGIARETVAVLNQNGIKAKLTLPNISQLKEEKAELIDINCDPKLVNRLCAVVMDVEISDSPKIIKDRLENSGTRSLNNLIDITNYVMKVTGHPTHVFDFDRLNTKFLTVKEARRGELINTLDEKKHTLKGGEVIVINDKGEIVDLMGIMGLSNSVVTNDTKRILYFINNNIPLKIRKASMNLGIRTEAAILNEKNIDTNLTQKALNYGIELFQKYAKGKVVSKIIDLNYKKIEKVKIEISLNTINQIVGVIIDPQIATNILLALGFKVVIEKNKLIVDVPTERIGDIEIEEDIVEEIARIYGYHNLPSILPPQTQIAAQRFDDQFYFEKRIKQALKYWGFTETYTYSFVSADLYEGPLEQALEINNPLSEDYVYMRKTLVPSLLKVVTENKNEEVIKIFEIANTYTKRLNDLPLENLVLAGIIKNTKVSFFEVKGIIETLLGDLRIENVTAKLSSKTGNGASLFIANTYLGEIEILDTNLIDFELDFNLILKHASLKKSFTPIAKFPPIMEDLSFRIDVNINTKDIIDEIYKQSELINSIDLIDQYEDSRTFHLIYRDKEKNLTNENAAKIREKIVKALENKFQASLRSLPLS